MDYFSVRCVRSLVHDLWVFFLTESLAHLKWISVTEVKPCGTRTKFASTYTASTNVTFDVYTRNDWSERKKYIAKLEIRLKMLKRVSGSKWPEEATIERRVILFGTERGLAFKFTSLKQWTGLHYKAKIKLVLFKNASWQRQRQQASTSAQILLSRQTLSIVLQTTL